jgi:hypothetical protein
MVELVEPLRESGVRSGIRQRGQDVSSAGDDVVGWSDDGVEQGDEADEAFGGTNPRAASGVRPEVPPHARAVPFGRGHRFAAYPRCSTDSGEVRLGGG